MEFPLRFNYGHVVLPVLSAPQTTSASEDGASTLATEAKPALSAFSSAVGAPPDPILSMRDAFLADECDDKLNLAVGVYRTAEGKPLVLPTVKEAEAELLADQAAGRVDKEYLPPDGMGPFCEASLRLLLGSTVDAALAEGRVVAAQSLSGTGGLHLAARMIVELLPGATVHLPSPTWPIHPDIFTAVGLEVAYYPYYDVSTCGFDASGMLAALDAMPAHSVVLLHACAQNPCGVDPSEEQWDAIARVMEKRQLLPLVDSAYQGLSTGDLDLDAAGVRAIALRGVEMLLCQSYSKNVGLYSERAGCFSMVCAEAAVADRVRQQLKRVVRLTYSSPPRHGAAIVSKILTHPARCEAWRKEVASMAARLHEMRVALAGALERVDCPPPSGTSLKSWSHVLSQRGMFTYSGLTATQVEALRERHHIYMPSDGRIAMASLTVGSCEKLARAIKDVIATEAAGDGVAAGAEEGGSEPPAKRLHV